MTYYRYPSPLCCAVLCCAVQCSAMLCSAVQCCPAVSCTVLLCSLLRKGVLSYTILSYPDLSSLCSLLTMAQFSQMYRRIITIKSTLIMTLNTAASITTTTTTSILCLGVTHCTARQGEDQTELLGSHPKVIQGKGQGQRR